MKKLFFTVVSVSCFSMLSMAQVTPATPATEQAKAPMSKEDKKAKKAKQDKEIAEAFAAAGLTEQQIKDASVIMDEASKKNGEMKGNDKLTPQEKQAARKANNNEKNEKLKTQMGAEKYKVFTSTRKKQKEASEESKTDL